MERAEGESLRTAETVPGVSPICWATAFSVITTGFWPLVLICPMIGSIVFSRCLVTLQDHFTNCQALVSDSRHARTGTTVAKKSTRKVPNNLFLEDPVPSVVKSYPVPGAAMPLHNVGCSAATRSRQKTECTSNRGPAKRMRDECQSDRQRRLVLQG